MDIYDNPILCKRCNNKMKRVVITKEGYNLRAWKCDKCNVIQLHPLDEAKFNDFKRLQQRDFEVKLRMIGNSFCVSIPKEIIDFEKEMQSKMNQMITMSLEGPEKLSLYFTDKIKKIKEAFEEE